MNADRRLSGTVALSLVALLLMVTARASGQDNRLLPVVEQVQSKVVKLYGSGGFRGLEPYQTGVLISSDGYILTVWSYVLDTDELLATLNDGQKFKARLVGYDARLEIAILKIEAQGLSCFNIEAESRARSGTPVLAFSNLFRVATGNEPASVMRGVVSAVATAGTRQGAYDSAYRGKLIIVDAVINNPGAAGGALTDFQGAWLGLMGKERRDSNTGEWLNFALPLDEIRNSVLDILSGKMTLQQETADKLPDEPMTLEMLGLVLVPELVQKTPAFVDVVQPGSSAAEAGVQPDDLIVEVGGKMTPSISAVQQRLQRLDRDERVKLMVKRKRQVLSFELRAK